MTTEFYDRKTLAEELKLGTDIFNESQRTPNLHNKLNVILLELQKRKAHLTKQYHQLFKERWQYYSGKADPQIYKEFPFPFRILKGDIQIYLDADIQLSQSKLELQELDLEIQYITEAIKHVGQRSYLLRNMMQFLEFTNGA